MPGRPAHSISSSPPAPAGRARRAGTRPPRLVLAWLGVLICGGCSWHARFTRDDSQSIAFKSSAPVEVRTRNGRVTLAASDAPTVHVDATIRARTARGLISGRQEATLDFGPGPDSRLSTSNGRITIASAP